MLSIRNAWGAKYDDLIIHITVDEQQADRFTYHAISNKALQDAEQYLTIEHKEGVSQEALLEVVYRLLTPQE